MFLKKHTVALLQYTKDTVYHMWDRAHRKSTSLENYNFDKLMISEGILQKS